MKEETKKFLFGGFIAALGTFLSTLLPYFEEAAQDNPQLVIVVAAISGLIAALNEFSNRFEPVQRTKASLKRGFHLD